MGISVAVVDITSRKRTEAAPRESEDLFHTANASCVGIGLDFRIALNERICDFHLSRIAASDETVSIFLIWLDASLLAQVDLPIELSDYRLPYGL